MPCVYENSLEYGVNSNFSTQWLHNFACKIPQVKWEHTLGQIRPSLSSHHCYYFINPSWGQYLLYLPQKVTGRDNFEIIYLKELLEIKPQLNVGCSRLSPLSRPHPYESGRWCGAPLQGCKAAWELEKLGGGEPSRSSAFGGGLEGHLLMKNKLKTAVAWGKWSLWKVLSFPKCCFEYE